MTAAVTERFPPELFDAILDRVYETDPKRSILTCALVCKAWLPRSRGHAFRRVYFFRDATPSPRIFTELIAHPLCTFGPYVHLLYYNDRSRTPTLETLARRMVHLPNIEELSINNVRFGATHNPWDVLLQLFTPRLKALTLESCQFQTISQLLECVAQCTNLKRIGLRWLTMSDQEYLGEIPRIHAPRYLNALSLCYGVTMHQRLLQWLCPGPNTLQVPSLTLSSITAETAISVARFLRDVGPSITTLALDFSDSGSSSTDAQGISLSTLYALCKIDENVVDAFYHAADLSTLIHLRKLEFSALAIYSHYSGRKVSSKHVTGILEKVVSKELRQIDFHLSMQEVEDMEMIDWEIVVTMLNNESYRALQRLVFFSVKEHVLTETKAWLETHVAQKLKGDVAITCYSTYFA